MCLALSLSVATKQTSILAKFYRNISGNNSTLLNSPVFLCMQSVTFICNLNHSGASSERECIPIVLEQAVGSNKAEASEWVVGRSDARIL